MKVITVEDDPKMHKVIEDRNLLAQYDLLRTMVEIALTETSVTVSHEIIHRLHYHAVVGICDEPGAYRKRGVGIHHSKHAPPHPDQVVPLMDELIAYLNSNWAAKTAIHLAAFTLWRICWIHPFIEGNGRTARAMCFWVLCVKLRLWVPGKNTIPKQIRENRRPYYAALAEADQSDLRVSFINLGMMEGYLDGLMKTQLAS